MVQPGFRPHPNSSDGPPGCCRQRGRPSTPQRNRGSGQHRCPARPPVRRPCRQSAMGASFPPRRRPRGTPFFGKTLTCIQDMMFGKQDLSWWCRRASVSADVCSCERCARARLMAAVCSMIFVVVVASTMTAAAGTSASVSTTTYRTGRTAGAQPARRRPRSRSPVGRCSSSHQKSNHQPRSRHSARCGRSAPSVVSSPCPGYTTVSSP